MNKERNTYSYSILRYFHDISTGEFINVGVSVFDPKSKKFDVRIKTTTSRVSDTFPDINPSAFKALMKSVQKRFRLVVDEHAHTLDFNNKKSNLNELLSSVIPFDDSALIWAPTSEGLTLDLNKALDHLYYRYVTKYEPKKNKSKRTDADLWRTFKKELDDRKILRFFNEKVITTDSDEVTFPFAWKNGVWHCIEPLSFDLAAADSMKDKAHKCLGEITSINNDSFETFKLYLLLSAPSQADLRPAFQKALNILQKIPVEKEIYFEDDKNLLIDKLSSEISSHTDALNIKS